MRCFGTGAVWTCLLVIAALVSCTAAAHADPERLGQAGRWFVDGEGRVVVLRGVNMVSKLPPYTLSAAGFGAADAALLAASGFNVVRVGVIYAAVEPEPGAYDDDYLDDIASTVALLASHGIWSLLDFHQDVFGTVFDGAGLPEWATFTDGLAEPDPKPSFPTYYFVSEPLQRAFDSFWQNRLGPGGVGIQDRYAAAWAHVAHRFASADGVLGYELMNEPFPGSHWRECFDQADGCPDIDASWLADFNDRVGAAIRSVDQRTPIFYEPWVLFDLGAPTNLPRPAADAVAFAFHPYGCGSVTTLCTATLASILETAEAYAATAGVALLATEWGAFTSANVDPGLSVPESIAAGAAALDAARMSWIYWTWANRTPYEVTFGSEEQGIITDLTGPRDDTTVRKDSLDALARPYPRAVAGTPLAWSFDPPTRTFELTYDTAPAVATQGPGALTEIVVPARHYPSGYVVEVDGGTVASASDAPILLLAAAPGATSVHVKVSPRTP
jgi:endoglycosylceramidase